jgi:hypothetical protein
LSVNICFKEQSVREMPGALHDVNLPAVMGIGMGVCQAKSVLACYAIDAGRPRRGSPSADIIRPSFTATTRHATDPGPISG